MLVTTYINYFAGTSDLIADDHHSSEAKIQASFNSTFHRYEKGQPFIGASIPEWREVAWKGDRIHKQIVVWGGSGNTGVSFSMSDLVGDEATIPSSSASVRILGYAKGDPEARNCDGYPERTEVVELADVLLESHVSELTREDTVKSWLTIDVPSDVPSGVYSGDLMIRADEIAEIALNVQIQVVDLTLPGVQDWDFHLDLWQFPAAVLRQYNTAHPDDPIELWSDRHLSMLEDSYRRLADAGQKAVTTYIKEDAMGAPSMIKWILRDDGETWAYDYSAFDRYVEAMAAWGIEGQIDAFSLVGWTKEGLWDQNTIKYWDDAAEAYGVLSSPLGSEMYVTRWTHFLTDFRTHLKDKGWFDKTVLYMDEVPSDEMLSVIRLIKQHDPDWKIGLAWAHELDDEVVESLYDASGILYLASDIPNSSDRLRTFYTSCTQVFPNSYVTRNSSPAEMVWMAWHAAAEGHDGYLRWAYDYWVGEDPFDLQNELFTAGDFSIAYRSSNAESMHSLSSVRLELLREGIQDYEKIRIIREKMENDNRQASLTELNSAIASFTVESGTSGSAESLVSKAQEAIKTIALKEYGGDREADD